MFGNPRAGTTFTGPVERYSEIVRKVLIRPSIRRLSRLGMQNEQGVFAEDFICRQLDEVIINLGSDYMAYGHLPHASVSVCRRRRVGRTYESRRRVPLVFTGRSLDILRICLYYGLQWFASFRPPPTFLSTLTVDTASSYGDLIS